MGKTPREMMRDRFKGKNDRELKGEGEKVLKEVAYYLYNDGKDSSIFGRANLAGAHVMSLMRTIEEWELENNKYFPDKE